MKVSKVSISKLTKGAKLVIPTTAPANKVIWKDGKPTDQYEAVAFEVIIKDVGTCQVVFPYRPNLAEELNDSIEFGVPLDLSQIGTINDTLVSIYNNSLSVKILMAE